jgi:hypothetical protein
MADVGETMKDKQGSHGLNTEEAQIDSVFLRVSCVVKTLIRVLRVFRGSKGMIVNPRSPSVPRSKSFCAPHTVTGGAAEPTGSKSQVQSPQRVAAAFLARTNNKKYARRCAKRQCGGDSDLPSHEQYTLSPIQQNLVNPRRAYWPTWQVPKNYAAASQ